ANSSANPNASLTRSPTPSDPAQRPSPRARFKRLPSLIPATPPRANGDRSVAACSVELTPT
ncbi:MAG: hypothetical protein EBU32_11710, partial [Opitutaceae bacterium]|nr:hypothetical protein [Opitutaceae bacterium]